MAPTDVPGVSRRAVLRATGGTVGLSLAGTVRADDDGHDGDEPTPLCGEAANGPHMRPCSGASMEGCADDHPATLDIQRRVRRSLTEEYTDVGALIERGYLPYFDVVRPGEEGGYSHWLNPEYVGDDRTLDPTRPEAVLVDNEWWRPIGAMFVATDEGERVDEPSAVYGADEDGDATTCAPWHYHTDLPGRFAWWFYRTVYEGDLDASIGLSVDDSGVSFSTAGVRLPCVTACMLHVWTYPNPDGVYAHGPPPRGNRGGPPAERAGFDTWAEPGENRLGWDVLPDDLVERAKPSGIPDEVDDWLAGDGQKEEEGDGSLPGWLGG